jgi:hypothetical protein
VAQPTVVVAPAVPAPPLPPTVGLSIDLVTEAPAMGTSGVGSLAPTGTSMTIPSSLRNVIKDADGAMNMDKLNSGFNPLKGVIGDYKKGSEVFAGKGFVPVKQTIGGIVQGLPPAAQAALAPLLSALPDISVIKTPAHQYNLGNKVGNRVIFYGGSRGGNEITALAVEMRKSGVRIAKQMTHFNREGQGGSPDAILGDGVGGSTHVGGYSGKVRSDWPADYGALDDNNISYNATLLGINYQNGVEDPIPQENLMHYADNADMWDAVLGMVVPFTNGDPDPRWQQYKYNPLDGQDQDSLAAYAESAASLSWDTVKKNHGAFYCAEGQYVVANMGPQERTLLKKSKYGDTKLGALIEEFQKAPGLTKDKPEVGWRHLLSKGLIDGDMYSRLEQTGRTATYLNWVPENTEGWQKFKPTEPNGLIATPMTVATLAWSLLRRYMPREGISTAIGAELLNAYKTGDASVKTGVRTLLGGADPETPEGQKALSEITFKASTGVLSNILDNKDLKKQLTQQAGFDEIVKDSDKQAVLDIYNEFLKILPEVTNQTDLDKALTATDAKLRALQVERWVIDPDQPIAPPPANGTMPPPPRMIGKKMGLMLYAAPQAWGVWAQTPFIAGTGNKNVIEYLATAMHHDQAKATP